MFRIGFRNQQKFCFGLFRCFRCILKQLKQTDLFQNELKQTENVYGNNRKNQFCSFWTRNEEVKSANAIFLNPEFCLFVFCAGVGVQAAGAAPVGWIPAGPGGGAGAGGDQPQAQPPPHRARPPAQGEADPGAGGQPRGGEAAAEHICLQVHIEI